MNSGYLLKAVTQDLLVNLVWAVGGEEVSKSAGLNHWSCCLLRWGRWGGEQVLAGVGGPMLRRIMRLPGGDVKN